MKSKNVKKDLICLRNSRQLYIVMTRNNSKYKSLDIKPYKQCNDVKISK